MVEVAMPKTVGALPPPSTPTHPQQAVVSSADGSRAVAATVVLLPLLLPLPLLALLPVLRVKALLLPPPLSPLLLLPLLQDLFCLLVLLPRSRQRPLASLRANPQQQKQQQQP